MKQKPSINAGLFSVIFAVVILVAVYTLVGTVDIVFVKNGKQDSRMNDVNIISEITLPEGNLSCVVDGKTKNFNTVEDLKMHIGTTLITNFINFKWGECDNIITINQQ